MAPKKSAAEAKAPVAPVPIRESSAGEFPKMVYGPGGEQKVVADADAQQRLGSAWVDHPDDVRKVPAKKGKTETPADDE